MPAPAQIRASGGGTASPLWRQILADVLDAEIATVATTEGAAYGAGLLAAVGAGWFPDVEAATSALVTATPVASPGPTPHATPSCTTPTASCIRPSPRPSTGPEPGSPDSRHGVELGQLLGRDLARAACP